MKHVCKHLIVSLLSVCLVFGFVSVSVFAGGDVTVDKTELVATNTQNATGTTDATGNTDITDETEEKIVTEIHQDEYYGPAVYNGITTYSSDISSDHFAKADGSGVTDSMLNWTDTMYHELPFWVQNLYEDEGWSLYVRNTTDFTDYGYTEKLGGLTIFNEKRIILGQNVQSILFHEFGHFIDYTMGKGRTNDRPSYQSEFVDLYNAESAEFCSYYGYSHFAFNKSEYWAECCYYYWEHPDWLERVCPGTFAYMHEVMTEYSGVDTLERAVEEMTVGGVPGLYYVVGGEIRWDYTGVSEYPDADGNYWYITNGKVDTSYTGSAKTLKQTVYVLNGKVDSKFNGFVDDQYVVNGDAQPYFTGLCNYCDDNGNWWYVKKGTIDKTYTGLTNNDYGWWYVQNGKVNFDMTDVMQNQYGWWKVTDSKVDFSYTGLAPNEHGWWYIENGKVNFNHCGIDQNEWGWWYVVDGQIRFDYTGVGNYCNDYGWWYIRDGQVDFSVNSIEKNNYGWWYIQNGKVDFNYTGVTNCPNDYGWWYVNNGKVDFTKNSVEPNAYGWWYVNGGKVNFDYTGVSNYANPYGWWYLRNGQVDFNYTGRASNYYGRWNVQNGKVIFA